MSRVITIFCVLKNLSGKQRTVEISIAQLLKEVNDYLLANTISFQKNDSSLTKEQAKKFEISRSTLTNALNLLEAQRKIKRCRKRDEDTGSNKATKYHILKQNLSN